MCVAVPNTEMEANGVLQLEQAADRGSQRAALRLDLISDARI